MLKFGRNDTVYKCSFCNKPDTQVNRLVAGPNGVYICDECVKLCAEIIDRDEKEDDERFIRK